MTGIRATCGPVAHMRARLRCGCINQEVMKSSHESWAQLACKCITCGLAHTCDSDLAADSGTTKKSIEVRVICENDWHGSAPHMGLKHKCDAALAAAFATSKRSSKDRTHLGHNWHASVSHVAWRTHAIATWLRLLAQPRSQ